MTCLAFSECQESFYIHLKTWYNFNNDILNRFLFEFGVVRNKLPSHFNKNGTKRISNIVQG